MYYWISVYFLNHWYREEHIYIQMYKSKALTGLSRILKTSDDPTQVSFSRCSGA